MSRTPHGLEGELDKLLAPIFDEMESLEFSVNSEFSTNIVVDNEESSQRVLKMKEALKAALLAREAEIERKARLNELNNLVDNLADGQTVNVAAPSHDNYILKVDVVQDRIKELFTTPGGEASNV